MKRFSLFVLASSALLSAAADDFFPVQKGNAWTFSYVSTSAPVVPNPLTTKDSGTLKWEIYQLWYPPTIASNATLSTLTEVQIVGVKQTRSLVRRTVWPWPADCTSVLYDSVYTPPRTIIDTISLLDIPLSNEICYNGDTCPFAVHDPTITMPAGLSSKDTTVSGLPVPGEKIMVMIVSDCSCLNNKYSFSFVLENYGVGPIGANISLCPGMAGSSYRETWRLINREYPTAILNRNAPSATLKTVAVNQYSGQINCSLNLGRSSPVRIEVLDVKGRLIKALFTGNLNAGLYRYSWNSPRKTVGIAMLRVRTGTEDRCVKIMTGF